MPIGNVTRVSRKISKLSFALFFMTPLVPALAAGVPSHWETFFREQPFQAEVLSQKEASQVKGALGPAIVLLPIVSGATIGTGSYLVGSTIPSVSGTLAAGAFGAVAGASTLLPGAPAVIVGGATGIGGSAVTRVIDSRPTGPYGSFPPGIGTAANCTPWKCAWKDGEPVPYGTPGSTTH